MGAGKTKRRASTAGVAVAAVIIALTGCAPERVEDRYAPSTRIPEYRAALRSIDVPAEVIPPEPAELSAAGAFSTVPIQRQWVLTSPDAAFELLLFETTGSATVTIEYSSEPAGVILGADLFRFQEDRVVRVASGTADSQRIVINSRRPARYGLLVVPELLRSGVVTVSAAIQE